MALEGWWAAGLGSSLEQAAWKKLGELGFEAHSSLPPETAGTQAESSPAPHTWGGAGLVPLVVDRALLDSGAVWWRRQGVGWGRAGGHQHPACREEGSTQLCPATQGGNCRAGVCTCVYACAHVHLRVHACMCACMHTVCACACVYMCVCMCVVEVSYRDVYKPRVSCPPPSPRSFP